MSRGSSKPCPGCGEVKSHRPVKEVCHDCKRLLKRAEWLENELAGMAKDKITVGLGQRAYWNEYISTTGSDMGSELRAIFHRIARAGSIPATNSNSEFDLLGEPHQGARYYVAMPAPLAVAIRDLHVAVQEALKLEYEAGKSAGHSLLLGLARGELSAGEFDAITDKGGG